ncbi:hypothetical protein OJ997_27335 [Solirubrobacter phytolaccae]|uniref:Uncharacterized protein n=1 Tax=Solirubrobacter phytolaccae TaxID=1404360 RepID=A0A9X3SI91_9ACTN|nr:hypothetical protein [Solirubrobacter phytolaccae]MDA0184052.1 hypothetical protein [Solirubrobacter phytolaccae]
MTTSGDEVVWHDFALSYPDHVAGTWVHETGPFAGWEAIRFSADTYTSVIEQRPPAVTQFPDARPGRVVQALGRGLRHLRRVTP